MLFNVLAVLVLQFMFTSASPIAGPTVVLDAATIVGQNSGTVSKFLGIPFAQPPTGDRRFRLPEPIQAYNGTLTATAYGPSCPQQKIVLPIPDGLAQAAVDFIVNSVFEAIFPDDEDCLSINVVQPASATPSSKLPVVVWIYGGGFELGSTTTYDGGLIVDRSIQLGEPVVYVSMNYRMSAFGFLASQEVKDAGVGNLGLQDQRQALRWVQKYISAFGGDPTKVTIWGESSGAISVSLQMLANGGNNEGLFRGAFMESGSPIPVGDITHGQKYYDAIVSQTGCTGASDTLACLRTVPYATLKDAVDNSPSILASQSLILAWLPRADGVFLKDSPQVLVQNGEVADVPFVTGDCDDEGTLFSLSSLNITTEDAFQAYLHSQWLPALAADSLDQLFELYPADITQGSPFDTGILNALTPQFKRIAAFQGDAVFHGPRRLFLQQRSGKQNIWSFLSKRLKTLPILGSAHASDLLNVYGSGEMRDYLIHFVNNLDPNNQNDFYWPQYTTDSPTLLTFLDGPIPLITTPDTFRKEAIDLLITVMQSNPV